MQKSCLLRKDFDFRRNSRPTVPLYADRRELLGFRDFFNSLPACRKWFFDTLRSLQAQTPETILFQSLRRPTSRNNRKNCASEVANAAT